jgi:hypothetical protein
MYCRAYFCHKSAAFNRLLYAIYMLNGLLATKPETK